MENIAISELKANLSAEIRKLKKNGGIQVMQRDVPVARLLPLDESKGVHYYSKAKNKFHLLKPATELTSDPVSVLIEDRQKESL